jgi:ABC-2 type transport system permease protein
MYLWFPILNQLGLNPPDFIVRFWLFAMFLDFFLLLLSFQDPEIPDASIVAYDNINADAIGEGGNLIESQAFFLQHWFVFIILAVWLLVPLGLGYLRFKNQDI